MIVNELVSGIIAIVAAYLVGAFPTGYVVTRMAIGQDIRQLGSGNVGANNVFGQVGPAAGITVGIVDVSKGAAAVAIAHAIVDIPLFELNLYLVLAGLAAVVGHIWPVYLRFVGGNGLAVTIGTLIILMPQELGIFCALLLLLWAITRNLILSVYISMVSVPISAWLLLEDWRYTGYGIILILILVFAFLPTAKAALVKAGSTGNLFAELLRRDKQ
ncbi:MAG TPA: glycerol-3-phosphate acyltransferase [Dehalococcoidia bacterium]|nr:glycerol-3-phosphate acyltransferase [Dehalococcoidia bacterium]